MFATRAVVCLFLATLAFGQTVAPQRGRSTTLRMAASRGYLGVGVIERTDDRGVVVSHIDENGPAAKAGIRKDDVLLDLNGRPVEDVEQFVTAIGEMPPGTKVELTIRREGNARKVTATLGGRAANPWFAFGGGIPLPPEIPEPPFPASARVGFEGEGLTAQLAEYFGVKEGVLVRSVTPRTPADRAGLKAGDVVVKVEGTPVVSPREISGLVRNSGRKSMTFGVVRNRKEISLRIDLADEVL